MGRSHFLLAGSLGVAVAMGAACYPGGSRSDGAPPAPPGSTGPASADGGVPFEPVPPEVYVAKVKTLLVGLAPTDDEVSAVRRDPTALRGLVDGWMKTPQYQAKMLAFFANAFQQSQISAADFVDELPVQGGLGINRQVTSRLLANVKESFARTVWQLVTEGRPLTEAVTTRRFMMTPPLMALYAYIDEDHVDDAGKKQSRVLQADPTFAFTVQSTGSIPIAQTLDPSSPNYMKWVNPAVASVVSASCPDPRPYTKNPQALYQLIFGGVQMETIAGVTCNAAAGATSPAQFADAEFDQWKMVTVREPNAGEAATTFYDLPTLRASNELVLRVPRVGFFSTPAFFAGWQTNSSNQARVTINQTLIVALGHSFDGTNSITPVSETALDGEHAAPGTVCYGCHQTLDPMRQFFRQAYTLSYHDQLDTAQSTVNGVFAFDGVTVQGHGIGDLATQLATHPRFAAAWTQKLCYYANSAPCAEDDPEFQRIAGVFAQSGFQWSALVRELFSSPITTDASDTKTADENGVTVPIARRDHWCAALSNRLGVADACGLGVGQAAQGATVTTEQKIAQGISADLPADGYSRGAEHPALANDPTLFFRAGAENMCRVVADAVVDAGASSRFTSANANAAIADFVHVVMALVPSDPRAAAAQAILEDHFANAKKSGASATDALKSTFVLACLAPSSVGIGL